MGKRLFQTGNRLIPALLLGFFAIASPAEASGNRQGWGGNQLGLLTGNSNNSLEIAAIAENASVLTGTNFRAYGARTMRVEVGTGLTVASMGKSGASALVPPGHEDRGLRPLIGMELASLEFSASTNSDRLDFIEWSPMLAVGTFISTTGCQALLLTRGGAAIGTLGLNNGIRPSVGGGFYTSCNKLAVSAEMTLIYSDVSEPAALASAITNYVISPNTRLGLRFEAISTDEIGGRPSREGSHRIEARTFITFAQSFTAL